MTTLFNMLTAYGVEMKIIPLNLIDKDISGNKLLVSFEHEQIVTNDVINLESIDDKVITLNELLYNRLKRFVRSLDKT